MARDEAGETAAGLAGRLKAVAAILDLTPGGLDADARGSPIAAMMRQMQKDGARRDDPSREIFARLGDKWSTLLLLLLSAGAFRHGRLLRLVGVVGMDRSISQRMLTLRLRSLERDGLITRTMLSEKPLSIEYALSPSGRELTGFIVSLLDWIRGHATEIHEARAAFEARQQGQRTDP